MKRLWLIIALIASLVFNCTCFYIERSEAVYEHNDNLWEQLDDPFDLIDGTNAAKNADVRSEYRFDGATDVAYGKVYKFTQIYDGKEVFGAQLIATLTFQGNVNVYGNYVEIPELTKNTSLNAAIEKVQELYDGNIISTDTKIYAYNCEPTLAYEIVLAAKEVLRLYVSAQTNEILMSTPLKGLVGLPQTDAYGKEVTIDVEYDSVRRAYQLVDSVRNIFVVNANNTEDIYNAMDYYSTNGVFEPIAVSAFTSIIKAYDFYTDANNIGVSINGLNGKNDNIAFNSDENDEIPIFIFMHYGENFENALCSYIPDSKMALMYIGDGNINGMIYQPGKAVDVLAHEYQHAVTACTTALVYEGDSGALNEAFSDIFGALIEGYSPSDERFWTIGEDATSARYNEIRSMIGGTLGQVYWLSQKFVCRWHRFGNHDENCDYNGVHTNSTIITHLQYELCKKLPEFFTREKIGTLWYSTLCALSTTATFEDFAKCFLDAAINLQFPDEVCDIIEETLIKNKFIDNRIAHTVEFLDYDGRLINKTTVFDGEPILYTQFPTQPTRQSTEQYDYIFTGWDTVPDVITEDIVIRAHYKEVVRQYNVTLINSDGKVFDSFIYSYGDIIDTTAFGEPPAPADNYIFDDWYIDTNYSAKADGQLVQGDTTLYAKFQRVQNEEQSGCASCASVDFGDYGGFIGGALLLIPVLFIKRRRKA